jgi:hypothetical protein
MAILFATTVGGAAFTVATPQTTYAECGDRLLTFPAWFRGLTDSDCNIESPDEAGGISTFIWKIALNILEMMMQLVGWVAVWFIIRGGFVYMTSVGDPSGIAKAKSRIQNAIIGLIIAIISVAIVNFVAGAIST